MQVIVTRPVLQAKEWVQQLASHGIAAVALPMIAIAPLEAPEALAALSAAWRGLGSQRLVVFVSPNAAMHFFDRRAVDRPAAEQPAAAGWPLGTLAGSPGPGTTRALINLGVPRRQIIEPAADAAQFDSEALWAQLRAIDWHGEQVLIVRGEGGRDGLAETLRQHGATVACVGAYRRRPPRLDAREAALLQEAIDAPERFVWFFSSSEAIDNLMACAGPSAEAAWRLSTAVATHPRIAARASACGFARVARTQPLLLAVVACIQSLRPGTSRPQPP